jgi:hypothetical protein
VRLGILIACLAAGSITVSGCSAGPSDSRLRHSTDHISSPRAFPAPPVGEARDGTVRPESAIGLPPCLAGWLRLRLREHSLGGGLGHYYQNLVLSDRHAAGCALSELGVVYQDRAGHRLTSSGRLSPIENQARNNRTTRFGLPARSSIYISVSEPNPGDFASTGCRSRQASTEGLRINGHTYRRPTTLDVCTRPMARPTISIGLPNGHLYASLGITG